MKLIDFLEVVDENKTVSVVSLNGYVVSVYDGKDSISEKYNNCEVQSVSIHKNQFIVKIKLLMLGGKCDGESAV